MIIVPQQVRHVKNKKPPFLREHDGTLAAMGASLGVSASPEIALVYGTKFW